MSFMDKTQEIAIQAKVFDFAVMELVRNHRNSFQPLWSVDSWAKFLIWLSVNCGLNVERETFQLFAESLGSSLTRRMRKIFFERTLENLGIYLIADPAERNVFLMPVLAQTQIKFSDALQALEVVELSQLVVVDDSKWEMNGGILTISWKSLEIHG
tara:strand:- start:622 stop:1089 length:468 start_codon:yes stop_codon:yes gene_type:complete